MLSERTPCATRRRTEGQSVAQGAAAIQCDLYDRGEPIGVVDVLIAATALVRDEGVLTRNADEFRRVDGLDVATY